MAEILLEDGTEQAESETILAFPPSELETGQETVQPDQAGGEVVNDAGVAPYAVYDGSISSTYVEYFRGYAAKLSPDVHYVFYRDGQYSYVFYYSPDLEMAGSRVSGSAYFYRLNTYNGYTVTSGVGAVNEDVHSGMVYSDFPGCPDLRGGDYYVQVSAVFVLCLVFVFMLLNLMYRLARCFRRRSF